LHPTGAFCGIIENVPMREEEVVEVYNINFQKINKNCILLSAAVSY
jgi:hypothetical protein